MLNRVALVTGATSGIGRAFAQRLASDGWDVILVGRDTKRLNELCTLLADTHSVRAEPLAADLSIAPDLDSVEERVRSANLGLLVNNAGLTLNTVFPESTVDNELYLLSVNVHAVLRLAHAALPGMLARKEGGIINVSSVTGFAATMPGSTYPASKAWVTNFSESIALSAKGYGVNVMALCPGYTRSEFHARAGIDVSKTSSWMWLPPPLVVDTALRDLRRGRMISVPGWQYKAVAAFMRHTPRPILRSLASLVQTPRSPLS